MVVEEPPAAQRAPAKGRILETASELFYEDGIRTVGVDRIISASSVTKATFYKHYRAKDNLIIEYIAARHTRVRANVERMVATAENPEAQCCLRALGSRDHPLNVGSNARVPRSDVLDDEIVFGAVVLVERRLRYR